jgi:hypothetical protein
MLKGKLSTLKQKLALKDQEKKEKEALMAFGTKVEPETKKKLTKKDKKK